MNVFTVFLDAIETALLYNFLFKLTIVIGGIIAVCFGYILFRKGIFGDSGDVEAIWQDTQILLKRAAPGTIFVVVGAIVLSINSYKGFNFSSNDRKGLVGDTSSKSTVVAAIGNDILIDTVNGKVWYNVKKMNIRFNKNELMKLEWRVDTNDKKKLDSILYGILKH